MSKAAKQLVLVDGDPRRDVYPEDEKDERYTPGREFLEAHRRWRFTIDAAAKDASVAKLPRFWSKKEDGLAQPWTGERPFYNPPWSNIRGWLSKALDEASIRIGRAPCEFSAGLLPAWTDREWWHELVEPFRDGRHRKAKVPFRLDTHFTRRMAFGSPEDPLGLLAEVPQFWCVWVVVRPWPKG